jgi:hypothetical protein
MYVFQLMTNALLMMLQVLVLHVSVDIFFQVDHAFLLTLFAEHQLKMVLVHHATLDTFYQMASALLLVNLLVYIFTMLSAALRN